MLLRSVQLTVTFIFLLLILAHPSGSGVSLVLAHIGCCTVEVVKQLCCAVIASVSNYVVQS